ncbi:hypothetical protein JCM9534A_52600 [Catenuloplanes indicus JCM 9534]|uniref:F5/8 type C domain-containing protein n=1 Tax=Catenuloplanes indicus TaxID=137267 RepID=A0AAE3W3G5_9ACTN|nr:hypothetical protein [Catenuloplanes indicus]MDQ0368577.1 hypothetical protein [Catenuloplanes indicus]
MNHVWPQWIEVDLGTAATVAHLVPRLPTGWEARTQTIAVQDGATGATLAAAAAAGRTFDPGS